MRPQKSNISTLASHYVVAEMGIRKNFLKAIESLGIDLETNEAEYHQGFFAQTFTITEKKLAIKFFNQEFEDGVAKIPNNSRYMLQPLCHTNILGNQLAIFPMLFVSSELNPEVISRLHLGLKKEGYILEDDKPDNIGLVTNKDKDIYYIIDGDSVYTDTSKIQNYDIDRPNQWSVIPPIIRTDSELNLDRAQEKHWIFAPEVLEEMTKTPSPRTSTQEHLQLAENSQTLQTQPTSL